MIQTVPEVRREWTCGLNANPSVRFTEQSYNPTWRLTHRKWVLFSRRKVIIDEIYARSREFGLVRCRKALSSSAITLLSSSVDIEFVALF